MAKVAAKKKEIPTATPSKVSDPVLAQAFLTSVEDVVLGRDTLEGLVREIRACIEQTQDGSKERTYRVALLRYTLGQTRSILDHANSALY